MQIEKWFFPSTEQDLFYRHKKAPVNTEALVEPSGETANKFNEHLELILDFMGVLEHEPELMKRIKSTEKIETK